MLLGDTIILDTLDHANSYRQEVSTILFPIIHKNKVFEVTKLISLNIKYAVIRWDVNIFVVENQKVNNKNSQVGRTVQNMPPIYASKQALTWNGSFISYMPQKLVWFGP